MEVDPVVHSYSTRLRWTSEKKGILSCDGKPDIGVACPPEFGGHPGIWSPEDMFIGSIELCTLTTFLWLAGRQGLDILSYASEAEGTAKIVEGAMRFTEIVVTPVVEVSDKADVIKAERFFGQINKYCMITNSVIPEVLIRPVVRVRP
jgi:organic hydroperoxide reductase OsmC/OhrA